MKLKRKIDEAVAGQIRKVISHFDILLLWVWFVVLNRPINSAIKAILEFWR